jgi:hypothetical protein
MGGKEGKFVSQLTNSIQDISADHQGRKHHTPTVDQSS